MAGRRGDIENNGGKKRSNHFHSAAAAATLAAGGPLPLALVSMHGAEALSLHDLTPRK